MESGNLPGWFSDGYEAARVHKCIRNGLDVTRIMHDVHEIGSPLLVQRYQEEENPDQQHISAMIIVASGHEIARIDLMHWGQHQVRGFDVAPEMLAANSLKTRPQARHQKWNERSTDGRGEVLGTH